MKQKLNFNLLKPKLFSFFLRLFLLPHKDQRQMHFALNIDPAIKQGQTRYHYLVKKKKTILLFIIVLIASLLIQIS